MPRWHHLGRHVPTDDPSGASEQEHLFKTVGRDRIGTFFMNPWFAAMIPLAIIVVLGSIAFLVGFKGYLSDDRDEIDRNPMPSSTPAKSGPGPRAAPNTSSTERATQLNTLRGTVVASDRLLSRASHERAVLVQFIDLYAPGTISIQEFLSNLRADYSRRVTFVARHLPTSDQAHLGATALEAADRQGCFLPFLEAITLGPDAQELPRLHSSVTMDTYLGVARELGLDSGRFEADMRSSDVQSLIEADRVEAAGVGVTRAPALILLDDQNHSALTSLDDFREAVRLAAS
ncbi:thioredoxin domain-containing protein (plasmid) [Arthrobacter agilis]|uniref:DsbA family protein n=2 Tax=Arthrobacter TaxID=1663 RepID=UPI000CE42A10|nr:thioredoxin domain-containing protein [Arthrobacter agilis]WDF35027.1 thioredoxin domain-containing protein [Arthrobacter agilis]